MEVQRREIEQRVAALYAGSDTIPAEVVDSILREGGNKNNSTLRIIYDFMLDQPEETHTAFVKKEYGVGGKGLLIDGHEYSAWFDENGMEIVSGRSVHDNILTKAFLSWDEVSGRIHQLLKQGEYLPQSFLDNAWENEARECATNLCYMVDDFRNKETAERFFSEPELFEGGYPDKVNAMTERLRDAGFIKKIVSELEVLSAELQEDTGILRFRFHRPEEILSAVIRLGMEPVGYQMRDDFSYEKPAVFVTQDEIEAFLARNTVYSGQNRTEVYAYFCRHKRISERAKYMKGRYGIAGGASTALPWYGHFGYSFDGKGIRLTKNEPGVPEYSELVSWNDVAKRIAVMIEENRYLTVEEYAHLPEFEREKVAEMVVKFYAYLPKGIERPFKENEEILYGEVLDEIALKLADSAEAERLHARMFDALKDVVLDTDDRWAEDRLDILKKVRGYIDGKYSIYRSEVPEETESEIGEDEKKNEPQNVQLSLFDYMDTKAAEVTTEPEVKLKSIVIDLSPRADREISRASDEPEASGGQEDKISRPAQDDSLRGEPDTDLVDGKDSKTDSVPDSDAGGHRVHREAVVEPDLSVAEPVFSEAERVNFRITDDDLGAGGQKQKYHNNMEAIMCLKQIESEHRLATPEEQEILSKYVGWGGIAQAFDERNAQWKTEYEALKSVLTPEEYRAARASTLNAFYTSPTVIKAMYEALSSMGLSEGNVLEPSCGVGNFMGLLPDSMQDVNMYGVELDSLTGRIARQLYQKNKIAIKGFEKTDMPDNFFDTVIGNVPFGEYQVADPNYDRHHFLIHDYFIARSIDLVRPGGVIAVVVSAGTMDKKNESARRYFAQRADLLGAVRLPNNAFLRNANTDVVADILFFQKRDRAMLEEPEWVHVTEIEGGSINSYFAERPEMILGELTTENTMYGDQEFTVKPYPDRELSELLSGAVAKIEGTIPEIEIPDLEEGMEEPASIVADPNVQNFSYAVVDDKVYFRENSRMYEQPLPVKTTERVKGMVEIRDITRALLQAQLNDGSDAQVKHLQNELNTRYDVFVRKNGLISSTANKRAFAQDGGYSLISALEVLDENGELERKADIFTKRTIRKAEVVTSVDTASEALAVSIGEKAGIDLAYMAQLTGKTEGEIVGELEGVIFKNPVTGEYETADEYLSGNVRNKLRAARTFAENDVSYAVNAEALERVQPKDLDASEIEVRLGAPWVKVEYIQEFMEETFETPAYLTQHETVKIHYASVTGIWGITAKTADRSPKVTSTYGTERANAYRLLEDSLNLKDTKIYDTVEEDGREKRVLNKKETMLAQQKQEMIKEAFKNWIFRDIERREDLCKTYNELFNSVRPREYDGSHIRFVGMNPEINLKEHQRNAIAHVLYGHNTLLAHCVGSGKTFEMAAAAMESKRLGLCRKSLFVVPNHLTEQWGSEFLRLYPGANILVATKKDFTPANRKRFCSRIATGDYDAIIIGHTQFEKIPLSEERRRMALQNQIDELEIAIEEAAAEAGNYYTVKQMEKMRENLETKLERLNDTSRKDNVVTFEELGVDRLFVDESQNFKNLFLYTKMRNVAGISQTDAQKSSDMFMKCQYLDEITGGRGVVFATGTPISNSMVELYTLMRYLQYDALRDMDLLHFDSWAASFGETVNSIELSPEGTGYRSKTRFSRFYNLPELMAVFKEAADIQTEDMLDLPVPELESITEVIKPSELQKEMVESYGERAERVRSGAVKPDEDNMLKITNDGRKCALDQRLLNPALPDEPDSKVNRCVGNVAKIWEETRADKSTQLIFCDLSTPKADGSFNVYDDIRDKLIVQGIPEEEIAFIHEANTELKKAMLFSKVRKGQVRILLGSTQKLGAGTNVQDRLIALHHLDCPWRPSDLQQQNGRILRQGNRNPKVKIFQYVTEQTFDSYMWQILEQKQKFISQIMTSKSPVRSCDDVDDAALSYAEIKALATGNPLIKEKMELDIEMSRLAILRSNYMNEKYRLESDVAYKYPAKIQSLTERIEGMKEDIKKSEGFKHLDKDAFSIELSGRTYTERKEAGEALLAACQALPDKREGGVVGSYHGFELYAVYAFFSNAFNLTIKGACSYSIELGSDPVGNMARLNNAFAALPKELEKKEQMLETAYKELANAKEALEMPFAREEEYQQKQARLKEVDALLAVDMDENEMNENTSQDIADEEKSGHDIAGEMEVSDDMEGEIPRSAWNDKEDVRNDSAERPKSILERLKQNQKMIDAERVNRSTERRQDQAIAI